MNYLKTLKTTGTIGDDLSVVENTAILFSKGSRESVGV